MHAKIPEKVVQCLLLADVDELLENYRVLLPQYWNHKTVEVCDDSNRKKCA